MVDNSISTIMSVYNGEEFIAEAVESVFNQTLASAEIIIIDDGSNDNTLEILSKYQSNPNLIIISQENRGASYSQNKAINMATGKYLNFIDADDLWHLDKNRQQLDYLIIHPEIDLCFSHMQQFQQNNKQDRIYANPQKGLTQLCLMVEKQKFLQVGLFDTNQFGAFIRWMHKAQIMGLAHIVMDDVLAYRRSHENNMTRRIDYNKNLAALAHQLIAERKQQ